MLGGSGVHVGFSSSIRVVRFGRLLRNSIREGLGGELHQVSVNEVRVHLDAFKQFERRVRVSSQILGSNEKLERTRVVRLGEALMRENVQ